MPARRRRQAAVDRRAEPDDRLVALRRLSTATAARPSRPSAPGTGAVGGARARAACSTGWSTRPARSSITRSRIESEVGQIKGSLSDLTENLERLRAQLRDIELQAETQMSSRLEAAKAAAQSFDPLEFDRFTRFQELTAHDGRVGQRRRHGAAHAAAHA